MDAQLKEIEAELEPAQARVTFLLRQRKSLRNERDGLVKALSYT